jgi:hypothetical protein
MDTLTLSGSGNVTSIALIRQNADHDGKTTIVPLSSLEFTTESIKIMTRILTSAMDTHYSKDIGAMEGFGDMVFDHSTGMFKYISHRISLDSICSKVENGSYEHVGQFMADIGLLVDNYDGCSEVRGDVAVDLQDMKIYLASKIYRLA